MKQFLLFTSIFYTISICAQKHVYEVDLFGKKIGLTTVERIDKGGGEIEYKLNSRTQVDILFVTKSSRLTFDVIYKNGKLFSSNCKSVKDDGTETASIQWDGTSYTLNKGGGEISHFPGPIEFSAILLYFIGARRQLTVFFRNASARYVTLSKLPREPISAN